MKVKRIVFAVALSLVLLASVVLSACGNSSKCYEQQLNYTESTEKINNPHQGFYRPIYVKLNDDGATYNKNIVTAATQVYHLRVDISAFSGAVGDSDRPLAQAALYGLDGLLTYLKSQDKNAVVRFAYDPAFGGQNDKEPGLDTMLRHVEQVCGVLNGYGSTVTAIETGLIGPWGEMHTSAIANAAHITPIVDKFLSAANALPVLVRTPKMIYDYLGITVNDIDGYTVAASDKAYRLGLYNDGFLGSASDLGTYTDREREVEFLSRLTAHLPYGGEVVTPSSSYHDIDKCLPEMNLLNLSYLNIEWHYSVIEKWKNSLYTKDCGTHENYYGKTAFEYIENHLGYRFVLTKSVFEYPKSADTLKVKLEFKNVGFGNLNRTMRAKLIFVDAEGEAHAVSVDGFTGDCDYACSLKPELSEGTYRVYLCVYEDEKDGTPLNCLRFANPDMWNAELKANAIGEITVGAAQ